MARYSIVVKNAKIIDGTGKLPFSGDIGVKDAEIEFIGTITPSQGDQVIDASGLVAAPGFVDLTSHSDMFWTLFSSPLQESLLVQGVTTIVGGSDGSSLAPLVHPKFLPHTQKFVSADAFNVNWLTVEEFYKELERHLLGVNFLTLVGYNMLRAQVLKDITRAAAPDEIRKMQELLADALKNGAWGLSFALFFPHGKDASNEEMLSMLEVVRAFGGISKVHLRDEGKDLSPSVSEAIRLSRLSQVPLVISHFKALGKSSWKQLPQALQMIEQARAEDVPVTFDVFPYLRTGSSLYSLLPSWARSGDRASIKDRLKDTKQKERVLTFLKQMTLHWDKIIIADAQDKAIIGKTIAEVAEKTRRPPGEAVLDILMINNLQVHIFSKTIYSKQLLSLLAHPAGFVASDGGGFSKESARYGILPHPRSFGAFPRFLELARRKKILPLEKAIQKITSGPARFVGLQKRGELRRGFFADIVIFDPESVRSRASYRNPFVYPEGIKFVIVNGAVSVKDTDVVQGNGSILRKK